MYKLISIYITSYYFFGIVVFLFIFGFEESLKMLKISPMTVGFSGPLIFFSSFIATIIVISLMRKRLSLQPYPYFMLGFYIGNLSLLLFFLIQALLNNFIIWKFPEFLLIFIAPFIELLLAYMFGFAFLALIPSWLSAYILFKVVQNKEK
ncbi:hypothetical protein [Legionella yabuuchiae]|uniref:hypothetical protein n=1 Tax=Legionella yabuuchiae TaxID=376727 RepID=UPI0010557C2F|nr:hypothetical protein [Legionella yabuuchiae]